MDSLKNYLKRIDNKKVSFDKAFKIMDKISKLYNKEKNPFNNKKPIQLEMDLKIDGIERRL